MICLYFMVYFRYNDELVAADFGHPCAGGRSFYLATRYHCKENLQAKQIQPGFLLALVETKILRDHGVVLWDLGGVDKCPLMQYKYDLTGDSIERPIALRILRDIKQHDQSQEESSLPEHPPSSLSQLSPGLLIHQISINDLLD